MMLVVGDLLLDVLLLPEFKHSEQPAGMLARSGGSAANTAAWMARLGTDVTFVGCVGQDGIGDMLRTELRAEGVHLEVRVVQGLETGCVAVELDQQGERLMRSSRGANVELVADDVHRVRGMHVTGVHATGYALLGRGGFALLDATAEVARAHGARLSFDPSSEGVIAALGREQLMNRLKALRVEILLPNLVEALALTGCDDPYDAARVLAESVPVVVVKCSERGAVICDSGELRHVPTVPVKPLDTTGAGDAFNAGLLSALLTGADMETASKQGHAIARQTIESYGGRPPQAG